MATFVGKFKGPRGFSQIPFRTAADQWEPSHTLAKALPASITRRRIGSIVLRRGHIQRWMCLFKSFLPAPFIYSGAEARRSAAMHSCFTNGQSRGDLQSGFALFCSKPRSKKKMFFFVFGINSSALARVGVSVLCRLSSACSFFFLLFFLAASSPSMSGGCELVGSHLYISLQPETLRIKIGAWPSFRSALSLSLCLVLVCFSGGSCTKGPIRLYASCFQAPGVLSIEGREEKTERKEHFCPRKDSSGPPSPHWSRDTCTDVAVLLMRWCASSSRRCPTLRHGRLCCQRIYNSGSSVKDGQH